MFLCPHPEKNVMFEATGRDGRGTFAGSDSQSNLLGTQNLELKKKRKLGTVPRTIQYCAATKNCNKLKLQQAKKPNKKNPKYAERRQIQHTMRQCVPPVTPVCSLTRASLRPLLSPRNLTMVIARASLRPLLRPRKLTLVIAMVVMVGG